MSSSSPLLAFWMGEGRGGGDLTFAEILALDDYELEHRHDWVQWVFPLPEPSGANPDAPVMSDAERAAIALSPPCRARARAAAARFRAFLAATPWWTMPEDHNHLRITRALRSLSLLELHDEARGLHDWLVGQETGVSATARAYWDRALRTERRGWRAWWRRA